MTSPVSSRGGGASWSNALNGICFWTRGWSLVDHRQKSSAIIQSHFITAHGLSTHKSGIRKHIADRHITTRHVNTRYCSFYWNIIKHMTSQAMKILTAVQYSCIGWVSLWPLAFLPEKKQFWHMSKLKQRKHRYLQANDSGGVSDVIRTRAEKAVTSSATRTAHHDDAVINVPGLTSPETSSLCQSYIIKLKSLYYSGF